MEGRVVSMPNRRSAREVTPEEVVKLRRVWHAVRATRAFANLTQDEVGRKSRLSPTGLSNLERGKTPYTGVLTLLRVAEAMDTDLEIRFVSRDKSLEGEGD